MQVIKTLLTTNREGILELGTKDFFKLVWHFTAMKSNGARWFIHFKTAGHEAFLKEAYVKTQSPNWAQSSLAHTAHLSRSVGFQGVSKKTRKFMFLVLGIQSMMCRLMCSVLMKVAKRHDKRHDKRVGHFLPRKHSDWSCRRSRESTFLHCCCQHKRSTYLTATAALCYHHVQIDRRLLPLQEDS